MMFNCKQQMPPDGKEVLLYDVTGRWLVGNWNEQKKMWGGNVPQFATITHWCYLPQRPYTGRVPFDCF